MGTKNQITLYKGKYRIQMSKNGYIVCELADSKKNIKFMLNGKIKSSTVPENEEKEIRKTLKTIKEDEIKGFEHLLDKV